MKTQEFIAGKKFGSFLLIEKEIDYSSATPLTGVISLIDRCPQCGHKIYQNVFCSEWCPNCEWKNEK